MTATELGLAALLLTLTACSSTGDAPAGETSDPPTGQSVLQAEASCNLRRSGVAFTIPACESCMQQRCCVLTTACFSGNPDCAALHACLVACPPDHPVPVPVGPGTPEVDAKTRREVENPCAAACEESHAGSLELRTRYDSCIRTQCSPVCDQP